MKNRPLPTLSEEDAAYARSLLVHEDGDILVFNKPSGLAVQGGRGLALSLDDLLVAFAKSNGKKPRLVHRLDRGTSGVLVVARTKPAAAFLSEEFSSRHARKTYLALVQGDLPVKDDGVCDLPLARVEEQGRVRMIVAKPERSGAQAALTRWAVRSRAADHALVELQPETGRMHQLRVHLSAMGCPILGDGLYGNGQEEAGRLMLHAWKLAIRHPSKGNVEFMAPVPDAFSAALEKAGLQASL